MSSILGGNSLYNILKNAKESFSKSVFDGAIDISSKNIGGVSINGKTGQRYTSNIFNREITPVEINAASETVEDQARTAKIKLNVNVANNLSNILIINYKNNMSSEPIGANNQYFYNKLNLPAKPYDQNENIFNPDIETIVSKTQSIGNNKNASALNYADFLYCKKLGAYPNNRLVVLRRFVTPAADDLLEGEEMSTTQEPISVLVTWFDQFPMEIDFGEKWTEYSRGVLTTIFSAGADLLASATDILATGAKLMGGGEKLSNASANIRSAFGTGDEDTNGNPWLSSLWYGFLDKQLKNAGENSHLSKILPGANPNLIKKAKYRAPQSLSSNISFKLTFEYQLRYLNEIDPHLAMHNIIANIIRMGTSTSINIYPKPSKLSKDSNVKNALDSLANGQIIRAIDNIILTITDFINSENKSPNDKPNNSSAPTSVGGVLSSTLTSSDFISRAISFYRFKLIAAMQADTGLPSGLWHVTVGNPFNPIVSVGDLILKNNIKLNFNDELSYNDFPTEVKAEVELESARSRGAQELERIFNSGKGRIYLYPSDLHNPDFFVGDAANVKKADIGKMLTAPKDLIGVEGLVTPNVTSIPTVGNIQSSLPNIGGGLFGR